jgi:hypothetical protein
MSQLSARSGVATVHAAEEAEQNPGNLALNTLALLTKRAAVPPDWVGCRPYGAPDDRPCEAWVES